ncbi:MAG: MFS transporter [Verrucomicrobia bacterium]|nr:MFS transporter [Verrucomicrobiota bacterium]
MSSPTPDAESTRSRTPESNGPPRTPGRQIFGYSATQIASGMFEWVDLTIVPLTLKLFTQSNLAISLVLSSFRICGMCVQPFAATRSDTCTSRFGRRKPFLLVGLAIAAAVAVLLGLLPSFIVEPAQRQTWWALGLVVVLCVAMKFGQDLAAGVFEPLRADLFAKQGLMGQSNAWAAVLVLPFILFANLGAMAYSDQVRLQKLSASAWADSVPGLKGLLLFLSTNPLLVSYTFGSLVFFVTLWMVRRFITEPQWDEALLAAQRQTSSLKQHAVRFFSNRLYLKLALYNIAWLMFRAVYMLFLSLFASETLGLTMKQLGQALWIKPAASVFIMFPCGFLVDRYGPKVFGLLGFALYLVTALFLLFVVKTEGTLFVAMGLFTLADALILTTLPPLVMLSCKEDDRGSTFAWIHILRASGAFAITPVAGWLVDLTGTYRSCYGLCVAIAIVGLVAACLVPNPRVRPGEVPVG